MATLQDFIAQIPTAQEGAVIGIEYHNSLLAAIKLLAAQGGGGGGSGPSTVTLAFSPQFAANDGQAAWSLQSGTASKPGGTATQATGWMNVLLPDGYVIDHMTISGSKTGNVGVFTVTLVQMSMTSSGPVAILGTSLDSAQTDAQGNFSVTARATSSAVVNNSQLRYLLLARLVGADGPATASIFGIQVVCTIASNISGATRGVFNTGVNTFA